MMATMLLQMSNTDVAVAIIGAAAAVLAASIPYYFAKRNEIALNILKIKLERYDNLLQAFLKWLQSRKISSPPPEEGLSDQQKAEEDTRVAFIREYQRATSYASPKVLMAIQDYMNSYHNPPLKGGNPIEERENREKHSEELKNKINKIFNEIRKDVQRKNIVPRKEQRGFEFKSLIQPDELDEPSNLNAINETPESEQPARERVTDPASSVSPTGS